MRKIITVSLIIATLFGIGLGIEKAVENQRAEETSQMMDKLRDSSNGSKFEVSREIFVIQSKTDDGYLNAVSLDENTDAPYGYILDDKYELGDIVEVTYKDDDIKKERLITGEEEGNIRYEFIEEINAIFEDGINLDYVVAEDGSVVHKSFYE